jgi:predicted small lipoprotein YifL
MKYIRLIVLVLTAGLLAGCGEKPAPAPESKVAPKHEHNPPHHGTPVVLGNEEYHVELVLDPAAGILQAYVLDGEMENFIRIPAESFTVTAQLPGGAQSLVLRAVANRATGEKVGDTALFEAQADWLKTTPTFDAAIEELTVRGNTYRHVAFNFPKGNDTDAASGAQGRP